MVKFEHKPCRRRRRSRVVAMLAVLALTATVPAWAASGYGAYAKRLLAELPGGMVLRPDLEASLNALASAHRRRAGLKPLKPSPLLTGAARAQAIDMALGDYVGHHSRNGHRFAVRFRAFAGEWLARRGENAARDRRSGAVDEAKARRLFQQWLDSSGHRYNLMRPWYAHVSTGAVQKGHHLYAVQIFWEDQGRFKRAKPGSPQCMFANCVSDGSSPTQDWNPAGTGPR